MSERVQKMGRWSLAWLIAVIFHVMLAGVIAWRMLPDRDIHVSGMVPAPDTTVELMPAQALEPAVFFTARPDSLHPEAAMLYRIEDNGSKTLVSSAKLHEKRSAGIRFDAVNEPGIYEIVVLDAGLLDHPDYYFDGEFTGKFPSGDGNPGGSYVARFKVANKASEVVVASTYDPSKEQVNEEKSGKSAPQVQETPQIPQPEVPKKPEKKTEKKTEKKRPKKTEAPEAPNLDVPVSPVSQGNPSTEAPAPVALSPEMLQVSALNLSPELSAQAGQVAEKNFRENDTNKFVAAAATAKKRLDSAYNGDGPVIGPGQQGNSLSHDKEVEEYLAMMHTKVHQLWALGYLLRLDTVYRQPGSPANRSDLEAVLEITLDSLGDVIDVRFVRSSGVTDFDSEAVHVAWNVSPEYPPPDAMRSPNGKSYIHWTFWRDQRMCGVFGVKVFRNTGSRRDALDFSLKAVNVHEKRLGLEPSVLNIPPDPTKKKKTVGPEPPPLPQKINPLED